MSGTINLALTQQFDAQGDPLSGGLLYFFTAGTTAPQSAFQDTGLTVAHPNPIVLDASGRVPMFYVADGFIKIRLADKNGVTIIAADQLLVIGPSGGTGSGGTTGDTTAVLSTGDIKARYSIIVIDGFVRLNGLTIGNVGSSATERAEGACRPLYEYLYSLPNILADVGQTKTGNASTDFTGGIRLILPDLRGRTLAGLDTMGNPTPALRLTSTYFGASGTVLGNVGGDEKHTLTTAHLPSHTHTSAGTINNSTTDHTHGVGTLALSSAGAYTPNFGAQSYIASGPGGTNVTAGATAFGLQTPTLNSAPDHTHTITGNTGGLSASHNHVFVGSASSPVGSDSAHATVTAAMVLTFYMKM